MGKVRYLPAVISSKELVPVKSELQKKEELYEAIMKQLYDRFGNFGIDLGPVEDQVRFVILDLSKNIKNEQN